LSIAQIIENIEVLLEKAINLSDSPPRNESREQANGGREAPCADAGVVYGLGGKFLLAALQFLAIAAPLPFQTARLEEGRRTEGLEGRLGFFGIWLWTRLV